MGSSMRGFLSAAKADWPITTTATIIRMVFRTPTPYASRHACSRTDAIFWTCIKIAKALREFDEEE